jgi:hypothetical protein
MTQNTGMGYDQRDALVGVIKTSGINVRNTLTLAQAEMVARLSGFGEKIEWVYGGAEPGYMLVALKVNRELAPARMTEHQWAVRWCEIIAVAGINASVKTYEPSLVIMIVTVPDDLPSTTQKSESRVQLLPTASTE